MCRYCSQKQKKSKDTKPAQLADKTISMFNPSACYILEQKLCLLMSQVFQTKLDETLSFVHVSKITHKSVL